MTGLMQDIRFGLRQLRKSIGFTAVAAFTLALGIGANTAIFSLVSGILLRPLPYPRPAELVSITGTYPKGAFAAMREQVRTIDVAAYAEGHEFNLTHAGEPVRLAGTAVSAELLSILGTRAELGRTFVSGEDAPGRDNYVVLSHDLWAQRFESDPAIIGKAIELEGVSRQVVGVMPADFHFPSPKTQLWVPLHNEPQNPATYWAGDFMPVIGRLRPDATMAQAGAEIRLFQSHVFNIFPWTMPAAWNAEVTVIELRSGMVADIRTRLLLLLGAVALVLLIACANVANLMLSRAASREKEMGIRAALGAAPRRITRQLLTESVLLSAVGAVLGFALAAAGLAALKSTLPSDTPRLLDAQLDWRVLLFTGGLAILTGLGFGLAPALQSSRSTLTDILNAAGRGAAVSVSRRLRGTLAIAEVALSVMLVISAGLLIRSFWALSHVNTGFRTQQMLTARITPDQSFCGDPQRCLTFYRDLVERVRSSPGVNGAALVNTLPLNGRVAKRSFDLENFTIASSPQTQPLLWLDIVTPDYFRVMGIPLISGRWFNEGDESGGPPVVVVSASTAKRFWTDGDAVGKHVRFVGEKAWRTVVGIVADVRAYDLQHNEPDFMKGTAYVPYTSAATLEDGRVPAEMTIAVRTNSNDPNAANLLHSVLTAASSNIPISEVKTMRAVVSEANAAPASTTFLFASFAGVALALGIVGVYGVLSYLVSRRRREMGVRMALGAQRSDVLWLVMKEGARFSVTGIALGLAGTFFVARLLSTQLYGISPMDAVTYTSVSVLTAIASLAACYVPARRAMRVDPMVALRND
ncbi:MAG TPA: ABC transporter permease [Candidatus Dormibacteraeota bacterium]|nr:ABC transporter permease [Candidatus Dormibacteraeota bacterium]